MAAYRVPEPSAQPTRCRLDPLLRPLKRMFRWGREHHCHAHGICAVLIEQVLRVTSIAGRLRHLRAVLEDHPQCKQIVEWLVTLDKALITQNTPEEARIEQVQDCVFFPTYIVVNRTPVFRSLVENSSVVVAACKPGRIPGRLHERVERVGLARGCPPARRASCIVPLGDFAEWTCNSFKLDIRGQDDWQVLLRQSCGTAVLAVNDRDRTAPVALA